VHGYAVRGRRLAALRGTGAGLALFAMWFLLWCGVDRYAHFPQWVRLVLLTGGSLASGLLVLRALRRWVLFWRDTDWVDVAECIERQNPRFGQRLATVISRFIGRAEYRGSDEMLEELVFELDREVSTDRAARLLPLRRALAPWAVLAAVVLATAVLWQVPGLELPRLAHRFLAPLDDVPPVTTTRLDVRPGDRDVQQSAPLQIDVEAQKLGDGQVWLNLSEDGESWWRAAMHPAGDRSESGDGRFTYTLASVDRDLHYYASGGDASSPQYAIRVLRRPAVQSFRIRYNYPAYTGKQPLTITNTTGEIEAPVGTDALVTVTATEPLQSAVLTAGGEKVLLSRGQGQGDNVRQGRLVVSKQKEGKYELDLISTREQTGSGPPTMAVRAQPDRAPVVRALHAGENLRLAARDLLPLAYEAMDDYGLESVVVRAQVGASAPVEFAVDAGGGVEASPAGPGAGRGTSQAARWRESVYNLDLSTMQLAVGDVVTLVVAVRDTAGQPGTSEPLHVLVSPRSIGLDAYERMGELDAAAQLAGELVVEFEAAGKALRQPEGGGAADDDGESASAVAGPTGRHLSGAVETAAMIRRSLLRATVRSSSPELSTALSNWVDVVQVQAVRAQELLRDGDAKADAAREAVKRLRDAARELQSDLTAVSRGERAAVVLADRENLEAAKKRQAPADAKAAERLKQTLQRTREEIAAGAKAVGLDPKVGENELENQLKEKVAAAGERVKSHGPVDFAAAAQEWAGKMQRNPFRAGVLDERLAAAAEAEAVRPDADLVRARDLQLASRAAAAIHATAFDWRRGSFSTGAWRGPGANKGVHPINPALLNEYAAAFAALQRHHETTRRPPDQRLKDDPADAVVRNAADQARRLMTRWAGDELAVAMATSAATRPATSQPADAATAASSRPSPAQLLAMEASAEAASRNYDRSAELDNALLRRVKSAVASTPPGQAMTPQQMAAVAQAELNHREARRLTEGARKIDAAAATQESLADETGRAASAGGAASPLLVQRQGQVASQIAGVAPVDRDAYGSSANPAAGGGDDQGAREKAAAAIVSAQAQLAALPQQLSVVLEAADARRAAASRAEMARKEAEGAPVDAKAAAERAAVMAEHDARDAVDRLDEVVKPVARAVEQIDAKLGGTAPEVGAAREVLAAQLAPAVKALREATEMGAAERAAADARQAVEAAQRELAAAQELLVERDPLVAARAFAHAATDALTRKPPDLKSAQGLQRNTTAALSRAWDQSIHQAAARRLAGVPSLRPLFAAGPLPHAADAPSTAAGSARAPAPPFYGPPGPTAREWWRLRPREGELLGPTLRESDPVGYEAALKAYFEALGKARETREPAKE
jgi:hypothetical protein